MSDEDELDGLSKMQKEWKNSTLYNRFLYWQAKSKENPIRLSAPAASDGQPHYLDMALTGIRVVANDGGSKVYTSVLATQSVKDKDIKRVIAIYDQNEFEYGGKAEDRWVAKKFQYNYASADTQVAIRGITERARAARILVEKAMASGFDYVSFDPNEDPLNRMMLAVACDHFGLAYDKEVEQAKVAAMGAPDCRTLFEAMPKVGGDLDVLVKGMFKDHLQFEYTSLKASPDQEASEAMNENDVQPVATRKRSRTGPAAVL